MANPLPDTPSSALQRVNTTVETTLLLRICHHLEKREGCALSMAEVLRIVMNEYAATNNIA